MRFGRISAYFLGVLVLCTAAAAEAREKKPYDAAYASGAGRKLERGVSNVTMGWMEIPREITRQGQQKGTAAAIFLGPVIGLGSAIGRTAAGAYETLTFPLGSHPTFTPLVQPEFVLDKDGTKR